MGSDNFHFDITGAPLDLSLQVAATAWKSATGYRVDRESKPPRMILYWTASTNASEFPGPMNGEALALFIKSWLMTEEYGPEPDHDGSNSKGWRVYNESWGHIGHEWEAYAAIEPAWLEHGK